MKTFVFFVMIFCVNFDSAQTFVLADPPAMDNKEFLILLQKTHDSSPLTMKESITVRNAISASIKEIKDTGELSSKNRDFMSTAVIHDLILLKAIKYDKEPIGLLLRNVCLTLNHRIAEGRIPQATATQKEINTAILLARELKKYIHAQGLDVFADLSHASTLAQLALAADEPEMLLSTRDIYVVWKIANNLESVGLEQHSKALHLAAAKATKRLKFLED